MTAVRAFITIGLALFWLALSVPPIFQTPPTAYTGTHLLSTGALIQPNLIRVDRDSPAYRAGLRTGDTLGCLSPRDAALLLGSKHFSIQRAYGRDVVISTCVRRLGAEFRVRFVAQPGPPLANSYGSNLLAALRVLTIFVFFLTGIALVMARPSPTTWVFFAYCLASAPSYAAQEYWTVLPAWGHAIASGLVAASTFSAAAFLLLFSVLVPSESIPGGWRRPAFYCTCAIATADLALMAMYVWYTGVRFSLAIVQIPDEALTILTVLVVAARLFTMERSERARFGWAAFAIIFGVVANDVRNVLAVSTSHFESSLGIVAAYLSVVMPLALMYAILKRHVIDVRFVISRTVVYAIITTLVVGLIGVVDWATSTYLSEARAALAVDALVTIALGFLLHRTYGWIERAVDVILFRRKHQADAYLHRLARTLPFAESEECVSRTLVHAPYDKLELTGAALFRNEGSRFVPAACEGWNVLNLPLFARDHDLLRFLAAERARFYVADLHAHVRAQIVEHGAVPAVAIPIFESNTLTGFALYGLHRDGTKLDPDEEQVLEHLCEIAAQAYTGIELGRYRGAAMGAPAMEAL